MTFPVALSPARVMLGIVIVAVLFPVGSNPRKLAAATSAEEAPRVRLRAPTEARSAALRSATRPPEPQPALPEIRPRYVPTRSAGEQPPAAALSPLMIPPATADAIRRTSATQESVRPGLDPDSQQVVPLRIPAGNGIEVPPSESAAAATISTADYLPELQESAEPRSGAPPSPAESAGSPMLRSRTSAAVNRHRPQDLSSGTHLVRNAGTLPGSAIGEIAHSVFLQSPPVAPEPEAANGTASAHQASTTSVPAEQSAVVLSSPAQEPVAALPVRHGSAISGGHALPLFHEETDFQDRFHARLYPQPAPLPGTSGYRASAERDGVHWINPYLGRTSGYVDGTERSLTERITSGAPDGFSAWWDELIREQAGLADRKYEVNVTTLVQQALRYSPQVQALQAEPEVQFRIVQQEEAAFDWSAFLEATYDELNDPVGSILQTGNGDDRFEDNIFGSAAGLRRRTRKGGEVELSQTIGHQYNNSRYLIPNPQATSELELSFRQPLLSRSGVVYNESQIVLARISANMSGDEVLTELQNHLYRVSEAYWQLYRARAEFFQRRKLVASARAVLRTLRGRDQVDTIPRQILRAQSAVARAEARSQRAVTSIRNAESQLRLLVNDPMMLDGETLELIPVEMPAMFEEPTSLRGALQTALVNRPDVSRAIRQMRASGVRLGLSRNELLPRLDFIVSSYVAGLQPGRQIAKSMETQFRDGQPGYTVGFEFEFPIGNRQQRARHEQRQWELKRSINVFRATVETGLTEVEIAAREVDTAWREMQGRYHAMVAEQNEASYLEDRFEVLPLVEDSAILLLQDLLDSYERLADEEAAFVDAQTQYALSIIQLRRATGVLLKSRYDSPRISNENAAWMNQRIDAATEKSEAPAEADPFDRNPPSPVPPVPRESPSQPVPQPEGPNPHHVGHSVTRPAVISPNSRYPRATVSGPAPPVTNRPAHSVVPAAGHSWSGGRY